ncbi:MAG TPA: SprT family zinc-dependent metalloprotease [Dongiaceae bacterium]|nr:SprT family zinc-dependent metalloprotease [Dongiaceae bacterium]
MPVIHDEEFGTITVRRSARATQVRLRVAPNGTLRASLPLYAPLFLLKRLVKSSRPELRRMMEQATPDTVFHDGQQVGKSHTILVQPAPQLSVTVRKQHILVALPSEKTMQSSDVVRKVRDGVIAALRVEAKSYLPKRLSYLAAQHGLTYEKVRFSHASSRWGSCSSTGTISLNIALMKLPFELIDYVLIHELSHTKQMNHSQAFWQLVSQGDPQYKQHRARLKTEAPSL